MAAGAPAAVGCVPHQRAPAAVAMERRSWFDKGRSVAVSCVLEGLDACVDGDFSIAWGPRVLHLAISAAPGVPRQLCLAPLAAPISGAVLSRRLGEKPG